MIVFIWFGESDVCEARPVVFPWLGAAMYRNILVEDGGVVIWWW